MKQTTELKFSPRMATPLGDIGDIVKRENKKHKLWKHIGKGHIQWPREIHPSFDRR